MGAAVAGPRPGAVSDSRCWKFLTPSRPALRASLGAPLAGTTRSGAGTAKERRDPDVRYEKNEESIRHTYTEARK